MRAVVAGGIFAWPALFFATFANRIGSDTVEVVRPKFMCLAKVSQLVVVRSRSPFKMFRIQKFAIRKGLHM